MYSLKFKLGEVDKTIINASFDPIWPPGSPIIYVRLFLHFLVITSMSRLTNFVSAM